MGLIKLFSLSLEKLGLENPIWYYNKQYYRPMWFLTLLAFLHGLLYVFSVPPWQHYDEPTHFEYARLIAIWDRIPQPGEFDLDTSREIANSMYRSNFWAPSVYPNIFALEPQNIGYDEKVHPPLYYILVSKPISLFRYFSIEFQLYSSRIISLLFYVLTILIAWRISCIIFPTEYKIQFIFPLILLFTPSFADVMTSVNNDVLVNFVISIVILTCVSLLKNNFKLFDIFLCLIAVIISFFVKRTAIVVIFPCLFVTLYLIFSRAKVTFFKSKQFYFFMAFMLFMLILCILNIRYIRGLLRLSSVDLSIIRIASDFVKINEIYLFDVVFKSFWVRFSWGSFSIDPFWDIVFYILFFVSSIGILLFIIKGRSECPREGRLLFYFALACSVSSYFVVFLRYLILYGSYIPQGRYMYMMMIPTLAIFLYGIISLFSVRFRMFVLYGLLLLFMVFDLSVIFNFWML